MVCDAGRLDTVSPGGGEPMVGDLDADELAARLARRRRRVAAVTPGSGSHVEDPTQSLHLGLRQWRRHPDHQGDELVHGQRRRRLFDADSDRAGRNPSGVTRSDRKPTCAWAW
jgi:hypothetical protein